MTSIESLREQAEQFVRWHRDRYWTVADAIRRTLPRYAHLSDGEVFRSEFGLADAQELVALRAGHASWDALVASRGSAMQGEDLEPRPVRVFVARPLIFVRDVRRACAYYVEKIGFTLAFDYGSPPFYAEVERDGVRLCIRHTDDAMVDPAHAAREDVILATFEVSDARRLFEELQSAGAVFSQTLRSEPYGVRGFNVEDPDGNRLGFFERTG
jgi:uncharacterized glyoxalase superfamily protein PhnB